MTTHPDINFFCRGRRVRYVPGYVHGDFNHTHCEDGTVSSHDGNGVFVRFDKQVMRLGWGGTTSQRCTPSDLYSDGAIVRDPVLIGVRALKDNIESNSETR